MLDHALAYAARGWHVHALKPRTSKPATEHGFKDASTDPVVLRAMWARSPNRNIAVRTCSESGLWVLDSDDGGEAQVAALEEIHGKLPVTPMQRTPSGGIHRLFAWPSDGHIPRRIRFAPGLDALGERPGGKGGYFAIAPSVRDDGAYRWIVSPDAVALQPAPQWLVDMVRDAGESERPVDMPRIEPVRHSGTTAYGRKALDALAAEVSQAMPGAQNDTLYRKAVRAGSLAYGGSIDEREAFAVIVAAGCAMSNQPGKPSWTQGQVEGIVRRAFAFAALDPTPAPVRNPAPRHDRTPDHDPETGEVIEAPPVTEHDPGPRVDVPDDEPEPAAPTAGRDLPFMPLGFNRESYFYMPRGKGQITSLKAGEHTKLRLMELAPLAYWERIAPEGKLSRETWDQYANSLMRQCEQAGIFDETRVRGRGAWVDGRRIVVHTGTEARIGNETVPLHQVASRFVYEASAPWDFGFGDAAGAQEAMRLVNICNRLTWGSPLSGALMAGWCVIAPVSGALRWRPHIWVTGASGSGKTTALDIIGRVVGPSAERFDGKTTEAAIRQRMGYDARPVILDEAEAEDLQAATRMQGILDLARVSSSGGVISKGGANHRAVTFVTRSCFCFSSINTAVRHYADESRVSRLVLIANRAPDADAHYQGLVADINAWLTPEMASGMFTRTVGNLNTVLRNADTFTSAAAIVFKSRRAADQIGPMLAGYYLCHRVDEISLDDALAWIRKHHGWEEYLAIGGDTDEQRIFQYIISRRVRVHVQGSMTETTIGASLEQARLEEGRGPHTMALAACGIKIEDGFIVISDSAENTRALFKDAPQWSADWKRPLRALPGADKSRKTERFYGGIVSRATIIPYGLLDGTYQPPASDARE